MASNVLRLNFSRQVADDFIDTLKKVSPVIFDYTITSPDMRDVLTKPEFADIKQVVVLSFDDESSIRLFMKSSDCRKTYNKFATK